MVILYNPKAPAKRRRAAMVSLVASLVVFCIKLSGYFVTHSTAILSDTLESLVNIAAAMLLMYGLHLSDKPPDEEHRFGHGKVDYLVASFEGGAIIVAAILIIAEAASNLLAQRAPHDLGFGLVVVAIAALCNAGVGYYLLRTARATHSMPLAADAHHVLSDVWTSIGVFLGLGIAYFTGWLWIDALVAIIFALIILRTGWQLLHPSIDGIMDVADPATVAKIEAILKNPPDPRVCSYHQLRHRQSGGFHYVDFHLQFPKTMTVEESHKIATDIERQIAQILGHAGVMAHIEPCKSATCPKCKPVNREA